MRTMTSPRGRVRAIGLTVAMAATALVSSGPAAAVGTTPYGHNLVRNGGAENGSPGTTIPGGWEFDGNFAVVSYGDGGVPPVSQSHAFGGGRQLFATGSYDGTTDTCGSATQFIHIQGRGGAIDTGHVRVALKARLGTELHGTDTATVTLQFRDGNNEQVTQSQLKLGPVSTTETMSAGSASRTVPRKTREFRVQLLGSQTDPVCDAFFDKVSVVISAI